MEVFYPIGWDDNGLATERRVQNYYRHQLRPVAALPARAGAAWPGGRRPPASLPGCRSRAGTSSSSAASAPRVTKPPTSRPGDRLGLSVDWSRRYRTIEDRPAEVSQRVFLRALAAGDAYQALGPVLWDVTFRTAIAQAETEDRRAGRDLLAARLRPARRIRGRHRHDQARAARRLRGAGRASRRRAVSRPVRRDRAHAAVRDQRSGARASPRRSGQGHRHRDGLHVRRPDRRDLVAGPGPARPAGARTGRPAARQAASDRDRSGRTGRLRPAGRADNKGSEDEDRRPARRGRCAPRPCRAGAPPGEVLRERRGAAGDHHGPAVVHRQREPGSRSSASGCSNSAAS